MATFNRLSVAVAATLLCAAPLRAAETVVGVVTAVADDAVHLSQPKAGERMLTLSAQTRYRLWITHRPWQQSDVADRSLVTVGRCVAVELRADGSGKADLVRVNGDEVGSLFCPCRSSH